ncbi:MAG: hypothetical protein R3F30_05545 [Planctomycetota bacterium]
MARVEAEGEAVGPRLVDAAELDDEVRQPAQGRGRLSVIEATSTP